MLHLKEIQTNTGSVSKDDLPVSVMLKDFSSRPSAISFCPGREKSQSFFFHNLYHIVYNIVKMLAYK